MLSLVGRPVLIQASLAAIPSYIMQCAHLPCRILDGVDRVNRNFLWGSLNTAKKIHCVGWYKVTKSKEEGGLGLHSAKGRNIALLSKLNWRFHTDAKVPWVKVLKMKYCNQRIRVVVNANKLPCSSIWTTMKKGRHTFNKGSRWLVGKDNGLSVWHSNWTNGGTLRELRKGPITQEASLLEVKDIVLDMSWDWEKIPFEIPLEIKRMIQAFPMTIMGRGIDKLAWVGSPQGTFDLKSAYRIAMGFDKTIPFSASWIWKVETLPKIKTFLRRCAHNNIEVKVCLERRGITQDTMCPICQEGFETILHALRDCPHLKRMWNQLGISSSNQDFWRSNLQSWLPLNGSLKSSLCATHPPWRVVFPIAIWNVWKSRNNIVFNRQNRNPNLVVEIVN